MDISGIYCIENLIDDKKYIGSSINIRNRIWHHRWNLYKNRHNNKHLQSAFNLYGDRNFLYYLLEKVDNNKDLIKREQYYIDILNPEYNISRIAGNVMGIKLSSESRLKISNRNKGLKRSKEFCKRCGYYNSIRIVGINTRNKMSESHKKIHEIKKYVYDKIVYILSKNKENKRFIYQFDLDGNFVKKWNNLVSINKKLYINVNNMGHIGDVCRGKRKTAYGYIWKYTDNNLES